MFRQAIHDRRLFLKATSIACATTAIDARFQCSDLLGQVTSPTANNEISVGVMGVNSRGADLAKGFANQPNTKVSYICDVDIRVAERVAMAVNSIQSNPPQVVTDFRRILDDQSVDVLVVAAPNHWHAPATILGCSAGKHVYVEKPCSYTAQEGEWAVMAARKNKRIVQMGSQRRSWPVIQEAIQRLHSGAIGKVLYARTWYNSRRASIGIGKETTIPDWLDWDLWQGPAPERPFKDNIVHYNWHWLWHWGNGELGNNGIHGVDLARWGLQVKYPLRVSVGGGHYRFQDDQETPDTMMTIFEFPENKCITWEGLSWSPLGPHESQFGVSFHGTDGSLIIRGADYVHFDLQGKEVESKRGDGGDSTHLANFLDSIRTDNLPNADIEQAHQSTLLCHLGNIAYRCQESLTIDPSNGRITNSETANSFWTREYRPGWDPKV